MYKKMPMSLLKNYTLKYTVYGLAWIIFGGLNLLPKSLLTLFFGLAILIFALVLDIVTAVVKTEPEDEMAELHIARAKAQTLEGASLVFAVVYLMMMICEVDINLRLLYPFILGFIKLLIGILFWREERMGD